MVKAVSRNVKFSAMNEHGRSVIIVIVSILLFLISANKRQPYYDHSIIVQGREGDVIQDEGVLKSIDRIPSARRSL